MQRSADLPSQYLTFPESQHCGRRHWWEWMLLIVTLANVGCILGLSSVDMSRAIAKNSNSQSISGLNLGPISAIPAIPATLINTLDINPTFTFDLGMILTSAITFGLVLYGLFSEKKYELSICPLILISAVLFCVPEYVVNEIDRNYIKMARLVLGIVLALISIPLTIRTVSEIFWTEYHIAGASDGLLRMYRRLRFFNALLKLDLFFLVLLATFSLIHGLNSQPLEWKIFSLILVYAVVCLTTGTFAVNSEMKILVYSFVVFSILLPLLVPFQIMSFQCILIPLPCSVYTKLVVSCAMAAGIISIMLRTYILIQLLQVYRHFGYGLTDAAFVSLIANESTSLLGRPRRGF